MSSQMATDAARRKREAARDFLRSAVMPLIEEVLVKKFCQTMDVIAEGRERAEPPVVNESFTTEPVAWQRVDRPDRIVIDLSRRSVAEVDNGVEFMPLYAAQKPAPDVTALVEALETIQKVATHKSIHTNTQAEIALGGIAVICDAALAAYRKGGDV